MAQVEDGRALPVDVYIGRRALPVAKSRTSVLLIDMPIGLSEGGREGRVCDQLGREALGPRRSSFFQPRLDRFSRHLRMRTLAMHISR